MQSRDGGDILLLNGLPSAVRTPVYYVAGLLVRARTHDRPHAASTHSTRRSVSLIYDRDPCESSANFRSAPCRWTASLQGDLNLDSKLDPGQDLFGSDFDLDLD